MTDLSQLMGGAMNANGVNIIMPLANEIVAADVKNAYRVNIKMSTEDQQYMSNTNPGWSFIFSSGDVPHMHPMLAACRQVTRTAFQRRFQTADTSIKTLVVGSSYAEIARFQANPNVHFTLGLRNAKDYSRHIAPIAEAMLKTVRKNPNYTSPSGAKIVVDRAAIPTVKNIYRFEDITEVVDFYQMSRGMKQRIHIEKLVEANHLVFWDSTNDYSTADWMNVFDTTKANFGMGLTMLPWELFDHNIPPNPYYRTILHRGGLTSPGNERITRIIGGSYPMAPNTDGVHMCDAAFGCRECVGLFRCYCRDYVSVTFKGDSSDGYMHLRRNWEILFKHQVIGGRAHRKPYDLHFELVTRCGVMVIFTVTRTTVKEHFIRSIELPADLQYVRLLDMKRAILVSSDGMMPKVVDFRFANQCYYIPMRKAEFYSVYNYVMGLAAASVTFEAVLVYIRKTAGGLSLVNKSLVSKWGIYPEQYATLAFTIYIICQRDRIRNELMETSVRNEIPPNSWLAAIWYDIRRWWRNIDSMRADMRWFLTHLCDEDSSDYLMITPIENEERPVARSIQHAQTRGHFPSKIGKFLGRRQPTARHFDLTDAPDYDPGTHAACETCALMRPCLNRPDLGDLKPQKIVCRPKEDFYWQASMTDSELEAFRQRMQAQLELESATGLANTIQGALKAMPRNGFSYSVRVHYAFGGPGTGKSVLIRQLAHRLGIDNVLIVAPFSKLRPDYTNVTVATYDEHGKFTGTVSGVTFLFKTTHRAMEVRGQRIVIVDEFTAMDADVVKCIIANNQPTDIYFVGDLRQTKIRDTEGHSLDDPSTGGIDFELVPRHELVVNYRNPPQIVALLNHMYGYNMESARKVETWAPTITPIGEKKKQVQRGQSFAFSKVDAKTYCENAESTVRSAQGSTFEDVVLVVTAASEFLENTASFEIVAISRHKGSLTILHDGSVIAMDFIRRHRFDDGPYLSGGYLEHIPTVEVVEPVTGYAVQPHDRVISKQFLPVAKRPVEWWETDETVDLHEQMAVLARRYGCEADWISAFLDGCVSAFVRLETVAVASPDRRLFLPLVAELLNYSLSPTDVFVEWVLAAYRTTLFTGWREQGTDLASVDAIIKFAHAALASIEPCGPLDFICWAAASRVGANGLMEMVVSPVATMLQVIHTMLARMASVGIPERYENLTMNSVTGVAMPSFPSVGIGAQYDRAPIPTTKRVVFVTDLEIDDLSFETPSEHVDAALLRRWEIELQSDRSPVYTNKPVYGGLTPSVQQVLEHLAATRVTSVVAPYSMASLVERSLGLGDGVTVQALTQAKFFSTAEAAGVVSADYLPGQPGNHHCGQLKLLAAECDAMTMAARLGDKVTRVLYVGGAMGCHLPQFRTMFPEVSILVIDPDELASYVTHIPVASVDGWLIAPGIYHYRGLLDLPLIRHMSGAWDWSKIMVWNDARRCEVSVLEGGKPMSLEVVCDQMLSMALIWECRPAYHFLKWKRDYAADASIANYLDRGEFPTTCSDIGDLAAYFGTHCMGTARIINRRGNCVVPVAANAMSVFQSFARPDSGEYRLFGGAVERYRMADNDVEARLNARNAVRRMPGVTVCGLFGMDSQWAVNSIRRALQVRHGDVLLLEQVLQSAMAAGWMKHVPRAVLMDHVVAMRAHGLLILPVPSSANDCAFAAIGLLPRALELRQLIAAHLRANASRYTAYGMANVEIAAGNVVAGGPLCLASLASLSHILSTTFNVVFHEMTRGVVIMRLGTYAEVRSVYYDLNGHLMPILTDDMQAVPITHHAVTLVIGHREFIANISAAPRFGVQDYALPDPTVPSPLDMLNSLCRGRRLGDKSLLVALPPGSGKSHMAKQHPHLFFDADTDPKCVSILQRMASANSDAHRVSLDEEYRSRVRKLANIRSEPVILHPCGNILPDGAVGAVDFKLADSEFRKFSAQRPESERVLLTQWHAERQAKVVNQQDVLSLARSLVQPFDNAAYMLVDQYVPVCPDRERSDAIVVDMPMHDALTVPAYDAYTQAEFLTHEAATSLDDFALNSVNSVVVRDVFRKATLDPDALVMPTNARGNLARQVEHYRAVGPGDGLHFSSINDYQGMKSLGQRYNNVAKVERPLTEEAKAFVRRSVDQYFLEMKTNGRSGVMSLTQFTEVRGPEIQRAFLRDAGNKAYFTRFRAEGGDFLKEQYAFRYHLKRAFKPNNSMKSFDLDKAGQGIAAMHVAVLLQMAVSLRIIGEYDSYTDRDDEWVRVRSDSYQSTAEFIARTAAALQEVEHLPMQQVIGDFKEYDSKQDAIVQYAQRYYTYRLGVSEQFLEHFFTWRQGIPMSTAAIRIWMGTELPSGILGTLYFNGLWCKVVVQCAARGMGSLLFLYKGDDTRKGQMNIEIDRAYLAELSSYTDCIPIIQKVDVGEFCGMTIMNGVLVPNIYRILSKIVAFRARTYQEWCEYQISIRDYDEIFATVGEDNLIRAVCLLKGVSAIEGMGMLHAIRSFGHINEQQWLAVTRPFEEHVYQPVADETTGQIRVVW